MAKAKSAKTNSKQLQFGTVALCEFATKSERNKHTLVNIFSGDVLVGSFPGVLHFGLYAEIHPDSAFPGRVEITIFYNDEKRASATVNFASFSPDRAAVLVIPAFQMVADAAGVLEITASADGYAPTSLLKKRILVSEELRAEEASRQSVPTRGKKRQVKSSATASPPPSSRSRSASSPSKTSRARRRPASQG